MGSRRGRPLPQHCQPDRDKPKGSKTREGAKREGQVQNGESQPFCQLLGLKAGLPPTQPKTPLPGGSEQKAQVPRLGCGALTISSGNLPWRVWEGERGSASTFSVPSESNPQQGYRSPGLGGESPTSPPPAGASKARGGGQAKEAKQGSGWEGSGAELSSGPVRQKAGDGALWGWGAACTSAPGPPCWQQPRERGSTVGGHGMAGVEDPTRP